MSQLSSNAFVLQLLFDADQISSSLSWGSRPNATPRTGQHAGALLLQVDSAIGLSVTGSGNSGDAAGSFSGFSILQCTVLAQPMLLQLDPALGPPLFSRPSPFTLGDTAAVDLPPEFRSHQHQQDGRLTVQKTWTQQLHSAAQAGRWQLRLALTVDIARHGARQPLRRVFYCDTELEAIALWGVDM